MANKHARKRPGRKPGQVLDLFKKRPVLKIICAISSGDNTREKLDSKVKSKKGAGGSWEIVHYNPKGTLNAYLSGRHLQHNQNHSDKKKTLKNKELRKSLVTEKLVNIVNARAEFGDRTRKTRSYESYIYEVNFDIIWTRFEKFLNEISQKVERDLNSISKTLHFSIENTELKTQHKYLEIVKKQVFAMEEIVDLDFIDPDKKDNYESKLNRMKELNKNLSKTWENRSILKQIPLQDDSFFRLHNITPEERDRLLQLLRTEFYHYYLLLQEDQTMIDVFESIIHKVGSGTFYVLPPRLTEQWDYLKQQDIFNPTFNVRENTLRIEDSDAVIDGTRREWMKIKARQSDLPTYLKFSCDSGVFLKIKNISNMRDKIRYFDFGGVADNQRNKNF